jgi:hypothetical protein
MPQMLEGNPPVVDFTRGEVGMVLVHRVGEQLLQPMVEAVWKRVTSKAEK